MTGLLLVNTGTPDAPDPRAVRAYLAEFLGDPWVLDMNALGRWLLLHLVILRVRPARSAARYREIWTERGSPLRWHLEDLGRALAAALGGDWHVEVAARYGRPSIGDALERLAAAGADRIVVVPLFPQYAPATTGTVVREVFRQAVSRPNVPALAVLPPFYDHPKFIGALVARARPVLASFTPDHVLLSFHGLPERQVRRADPSGSQCLAGQGCCDTIGLANRLCYRAQCHATARALGTALGLDASTMTMAFQSRLGRNRWLRPHTDQVLVDLARRGVRRLAVMCPAFVADCLETLDEVGRRGRETFLAAGGEELVLVPSLDDDPIWVQGLLSLIAETSAWLHPAALAPEMVDG